MAPSKHGSKQGKGKGLVVELGEEEHLRNSSRYSTSDHWPGIYNLPPGPPPTNYSHNDQSSCQVCFWNVKDMAFGCGHQTCYDCGREMEFCPFCRSHITTKIRLS